MIYITLLHHSVCTRHKITNVPLLWQHFNDYLCDVTDEQRQTQSNDNTTVSDGFSLPFSPWSTMFFFHSKDAELYF